MNYYEATYIKQFANSNNTRDGKANLVTAKTKIASLVNDDWIYSMHWPEDETWVNQARKDVDKALISARERVSELEQARGILDCIYLDADKSEESGL